MKSEGIEMSFACHQMEFIACAAIPPLTPTVVLSTQIPVLIQMGGFRPKHRRFDFD